jgi:hypothetical protein
VNLFVTCDVDEIVCDRNQHVGSRSNVSDLVFELCRTPAALIQELSGGP